jgi:predicted NUDIX family phosphoesterase
MIKTEPILTLKRNDLPDDWLKNQLALPDNPHLMDTINKQQFNWTARNIAEENTQLKQLIPYVLVEYKSKLASYLRKGNEKRLNGFKSLGVGGHIEMKDKRTDGKLMDMILSGATREIQEEFGLQPSNYAQLKFLGIINEEETAVGRVHLGIVLLCKPNILPTPLEELHNLEWITTDTIHAGEYELWSVLALTLYENHLTQTK